MHDVIIIYEYNLIFFTPNLNLYIYINIFIYFFFIIYLEILNIKLKKSYIR